MIRLFREMNRRVCRRLAAQKENSLDLRVFLLGDLVVNFCFRSDAGFVEAGSF